MSRGLEDLPAVPDTPAAIRGEGAAVARSAADLLELPATQLERWTQLAITALRDDLRDGRQPPVATVIVRTAERIRFHQQVCCEEVRWFVNRMKRRLRGLPRPWLAAAVPGAGLARRHVRAYSPANRPLPEEHCRRLRWYVEARTPMAAAALAGTVSRDSTGPVAGSPQATLPSHEPVLGRLLWGHPARRRHRL